MQELKVLIKEFINSWIECDMCHYMIRKDLIQDGDDYIYTKLCNECNNVINNVKEYN